MKTKQEHIDKIKSHINLYGSFTTAEVEADHSPIAPYYGNMPNLIEEFFENGGQVVVYDRNDNEIDSYEIPYEKIETDQLEYISELCDKHLGVLIEIFLEDFCDEVYDMPSHALELLMDNHKCIDYKGTEYFVPENNSSYEKEDENIYEYLIENYGLWKLN